MALRYKIDVMAALKERGYSSTKIREDRLIGQSYLQQLRHGELVSWKLSGGRHSGVCKGQRRGITTPSYATWSPSPSILKKENRKPCFVIDGAVGSRIFLINTHIIYIIWPEKFPKASGIRGTIDTSINIAAHPCASFNILEHLCVS